MMQEVLHLPGGLLLFLTFCLLLQRRNAGLVALHRAAGVVLAMAACLEGWAQQELQLYLVGVVILLAKAGLMPNLLRRWEDAEPVRGAFLPALLGVALIAVAALAARPVPGSVFTGGNLTVTLAVALLGLLAAAAAQSWPGRMSGLLALESAVLLAVVTLPGLPLPVGFCVAVLALSGAVMAAFSIGADTMQGRP